MASDSDHLYRRIVDSAFDFAIFATDAEGRIETWNTGAQRMFQYEPEEAIGRTTGFLFTAEDRALAEDDREIAIAASEGRAPDDRWHVRKDGSRLWANGVLHALRNEQGVVERFVKVILDRTDARRMQEDLARSEEQFARLFLGNPAAVVVERQSDDRLVLANDAFFRLTGFWRAEVMGQRAEDLGLWANPSQRARSVERVTADGEAVSGRIDLKRKSGELQPCAAALRRTSIENSTCIIYTLVPLAE